MNHDPMYGLVVRRDIRDWVMQTPQCEECGYFISISFSGPQNDCIWPKCSNPHCSFGGHDLRFFRPCVQSGPWQCEKAVLALYFILWKVWKIPRDLVRMICQMVGETRRDYDWRRRIK